MDTFHTDAWLFFGFHACIALLLTPRSLLFGTSFFENINTVMHAVGERLKTLQLPAFQFLAFGACGAALLPFLPLRWSEPPLKLVCIALTATAIVSLMWDAQRTHTWHMFRTEPAMGYMWQDTINIYLICALVSPNPWILSGPWTSMMFAPRVTRMSWRFAISFFIIATIIVIPAIAPMINPGNGLLEFRGFQTPSVLGQCWGWGLIVCWVRMLHLLARAVRSTVRSHPFSSIAWLVFTAILVLNYVCVVWPLHFAYCHHHRLQQLS